MNRFGRLAVVVLAVLGVGSFSGCYSYVPVEHASPGSIVRVHVPVRSAAQNPNARVETVQIEGVLLTDQDSIVVETKNQREFGAFRTVMEVDTLRVERSGISAMELQVFSKPKTYGMVALVGVGAAGIVGALVKAAGGTGGDSGAGPGGTTGTQIRVIPIFQGLVRLIGR